MTPSIKKPRAGRAPSLGKAEKIDNLLRKMQMGLGYDPLVELVSLARKPSTTNSEKIKIAQELMGYVYPKVKSVSTDPNMGDVINITVAYDDSESAKKLESIMPVPLTSDEIAERRGLPNSSLVETPEYVF